MKERHAFIIIMIKIKEDLLTFNTIILFVLNKNVTIKIVNFHIINFNNFIIQIDIKLNFVNFTQITSINATIKISALLHILKIKSYKISNSFIYMKKTLIFIFLNTKLFGVHLLKSMFFHLFSH